MKLTGILRYWLLSVLTGSCIVSVFLYVHEAVLLQSFSNWEMLYGNAVFALFFSMLFSIPVPLLFVILYFWIRKETRPADFYMRWMWGLSGVYLLVGVFQSGWYDSLRILYFGISYALPGWFFLRKELKKRQDY